MWKICLMIYLGNLHSAMGKENQKPYNLNVLSILMYSGYEPRDNKLCEAAIEMTAAIINNRSDILPDYHLTFDHRDEGPVAAKAVPNAIGYTRKWEDHHPANTYPSPVMMGPFLPDACRAWGLTAAHMNMVMIAGSCTPPTLTARRKIFANMYRIRGPSELSVFARLNYLKTQTSVRKFAIIFLNVNQDVANVAFQWANRLGFEVQVYEVVITDPDESTMMLLKNRDIRIFSLDIANVDMIIRFLCAAHRHGMKGNRYLFISLLLGFFNVYNLPYQYRPGCNRDMLLEQYDRIVFIGASFDASLPLAERTTLGHSREEFERLFSAYTNNTRTPDYDMRHVCYDRIVSAAVILNNTENQLRARNMSLRDYQTKPYEVMMAANESASRLRYKSVRYGESYYSARLEYDQEPQVVVKFDKERRAMKIIAVVKCKPDAPPTDPLSYFVEYLDKLAEISIPNDGPFVMLQEIDMPEAAFIVVSALAALLAIIQLLLIVRLAKKEQFSKDFLIGKLMIVLGCLVMDGAAVLFVLRNHEKSIAVCNLQVIALAFGISILHFSFAARLYDAHRSYDHQPQLANASKGSVAFGKAGSEKLSFKAAGRRSNSQRDSNDQKLRISASIKQTSVTVSSNFGKKIQPKPISLPVVICLGLTTCLLIGWLVHSPFEFRRIDDDPVYESTIDSLKKSWAVLCASKEPLWLAGLIAWNTLPLLFGLFTSTKLRKLKLAGVNETLNNDQKLILLRYGDVGRYLVACVGTSTLFVSVMGIVFLLSSVQWMQKLTLACGAILYSVLISVILLAEGIKRASS